MRDPTTVEIVRVKYQQLQPLLNERLRRRWAAAEAAALGWGGPSAVAEATGLSRNTIRAGIAELRKPLAVDEELPPHRVRVPGAGRPTRAADDRTLQRDLESLVEPTTRGDPMSPLRWTCKSTRQLAAELQHQGHTVGYRTVAALLDDLEYSLQGLRMYARRAESGPLRPARRRPETTEIAGGYTFLRRLRRPITNPKRERGIST
jgi:Rhodopirellula transposase DDE domain